MKNYGVIYNRICWLKYWNIFKIYIYISIMLDSKSLEQLTNREHKLV